MRLLPKTKALLVGMFLLLLLNFVDLDGGDELEPLPSIPVMIKDDISRLEISTAVEKIILEKEGSQWMLKSPTQAKADTARIKSLILNFRKEIRMDALIDTSEEEEYGLDAGNAIIVEVWTDGSQPAASFLLGNDSAYGSSFVRISGSDAIYRARVGGRRRYAHTASDWQSQQVLDFSLEEFQALTVTQIGAAPYRILRDEGWKVAPVIVGELDEDRIDKAVRALSLLRIGDRLQAEAFQSVVDFEFELVDGSGFKMGCSKPVSGSVLVQVGDSDEVYRTASPAIERFLQGAGFFKDRRIVRMNTRQDMDMIRFHSASLDIVIQQDLSTGFWTVLQPSNIDLDIRQIFFMANTLGALEAFKEIDDQETYMGFFAEPTISLDIRSLQGAVKTIEIAKELEIEGVRGFLARDKQEDVIFLASQADVKTILTGFGQADFFAGVVE